MMLRNVKLDVRATMDDVLWLDMVESNTKPSTNYKFNLEVDLLRLMNNIAWLTIYKVLLQLGNGIHMSCLLSHSKLQLNSLMLCYLKPEPHIFRYACTCITFSFSHNIYFLCLTLVHNNLIQIRHQ